MDNLFAHNFRLCRRPLPTHTRTQTYNTVWQLYADFRCIMLMKPIISLINKPCSSMGQAHVARCVHCSHYTRITHIIILQSNDFSPRMFAARCANSLHMNASLAVAIASPPTTKRLAIKAHAQRPNSDTSNDTPYDLEIQHTHVEGDILLRRRRRRRICDQNKSLHILGTLCRSFCCSFVRTHSLSTHVQTAAIQFSVCVLIVAKLPSAPAHVRRSTSSYTNNSSSTSII